MDGMFMVGGDHALEGLLLRHASQGNAGLDAAVIESADAVKADFKAVLSQQQHSPGSRTPAAPGSPPARVTGGLAESAEKSKPVFLPKGVVVRVSVSTFYARFLENGWIPHGRGSRDQRGQRRSAVTRRHTQAHDSHRKVEFPFLDEVEKRAIETLGAAAEAIRFE